MKLKCLLSATIVTVIVFAGLSATPALAGPPAPIVETLVQPDGATFEARQFGNEWVNGYETTAGYTVVQDEETGYWYYAIQDENGRLVPSNLRPDRDQPEGIEPHLRDATPLAPSRSPFGPGSPPLRAQNLGTQSILVILASFSDQGSVGTTEAQWNSSLFGATGSVKGYYDEVSYGQLTLSPATESYGTANNGIVGWLNLGYNHPNTGGNTDDRNRQLTKDAIVAADPYIDYSSYDADSNGYITNTELHVIVIVAGYEASYGGSPTPKVWGHRWSLGWSVPAPTVDGVVVGDYSNGGGYAQFGEWHGPALSGHIATIGIMVHELGHDLSWPDLYDTDGSSEGVGEWSVMGSGSWLGTTFSGDTPGHPSAWEKWYQGWLTPVQLQGTNTNYNVPRVEDNKTNSVIQLLDNPNGVDWSFGQTSGTGEYFLVENRQKTGYDAALPGCGLLIWHIDETRTSNNAENRKLVDLEEADGLNHLDNMTNRGDPGDPFPGSSNNTTFNNASNPNSKLYDNSVSGVSVTNISPGCADIKMATFIAPPPIIVTSNSGGTGGPDCTLRDAITAANTDTATGGCPAGNGADTILLQAPFSLYRLTAVDNTTDGSNGLPSITSEITIVNDHASAPRSFIDHSPAPGTPDFRIFHVASTGHLTLEGVVVQNGRGVNGGGIFNRGTVTLDDSQVIGNEATNNGAGIYNGKGTVTLTNSDILGNEALIDGGGIFNNGGVVTLSGNSIISNNTANVSGGGIKNDNGGTVELTDTTISDNSAYTVDGGGIDNLGTLKLTNSTVSGNSAGRDGGGIDNFEESLVTLVNSTVSGNHANFGGGIANQGTVELTNSTITGNSANNEGGGIKNFFPGNMVELVNTIVAGQALGTDCHGIPVTSNGHNLDSDGSCGFSAPGDLTADPLLGPLQNNGGPTETHALLTGSPAIDTADDVACPATDQRGKDRPIDGDGNGLAICDIGAFEKEEPTAITLLSFTAHPAVDHVTLAWQTGTETNNAGFNLHRATSAAGPYTRLNDALIPAEGDELSGTSYAYTDADVVKGVTYYYKLEDVDIHGVSTFHGPVTATPGPIRSIYLPVIIK